MSLTRFLLFVCFRVSCVCMCLFVCLITYFLKYSRMQDQQVFHMYLLDPPPSCPLAPSLPSYPLTSPSPLTSLLPPHCPLTARFPLTPSLPPHRSLPSYPLTAPSPPYSLPRTFSLLRNNVLIVLAIYGKCT